MSRMKLQGRVAPFARARARRGPHLFVYAATHFVSLRPARATASRARGAEVKGKSRDLQGYARACVESGFVAQGLL